jgi:hypothetical protein
VGYHFGVFVFHFDMVSGAVPGVGAAMAAGWVFRHLIWPFASKSIGMLTIVLFAGGLLCFALFFKAIDYFEKI